MSNAKKSPKVGTRVLRPGDQANDASVGVVVEVSEDDAMMLVVFPATRRDEERRTWLPFEIYLTPGWKVVS